MGLGLNRCSNNQLKPLPPIPDQLSKVFPPLIEASDLGCSKLSAEPRDWGQPVTAVSVAIPTFLLVLAFQDDS
jgi:hypothetical protein